MKTLLKIVVVAVLFIAALLTNVSINTSKNGGDAYLLDFKTEAKADCEIRDWIINGSCLPFYYICVQSDPWTGDCTVGW